VTDFWLDGRGSDFLLPRHCTLCPPIQWLTLSALRNADQSLPSNAKVKNVLLDVPCSVYMTTFVWGETSQGIPRILWNRKVHYRVQKNLSLVSILSQIHLVHNFETCAFNIHSNINSPTPRSSDWSFPFKSSDKNIVCISPAEILTFYVPDALFFHCLDRSKEFVQFRCPV
jgi:hypothetical protein